MRSPVTFMLKNPFSVIQPLPLLAGVVSLTLSAMTAAPVLAESTTPTASTPSQPPLRHTSLNLTKEQQAQIQRIRQAEHKQIDTILTAEQKTRLKAARANHTTPRQSFASLNLTAEQQRTLQEVHRASRDWQDSVLTAEQRQQLQHDRAVNLPAAGTPVPQ